MKPSTSLGTKSNVGMEKPAPSVRQAGNIRVLLVMCGVCRSSVLRDCDDVNYRRRCRVIGQHNTWQKRTREERAEGTAVVSRSTTDLPTHGLCGWEGRGVSTSHSLAI